VGVISSDDKSVEAVCQDSHGLGLEVGERRNKSGPAANFSTWGLDTVGDIRNPVLEVGKGKHQVVELGETKKTGCSRGQSKIPLARLLISLLVTFERITSKKLGFLLL